MNSKIRRLNIKLCELLQVLTEAVLTLKSKYSWKKHNKQYNLKSS